MDEQIKVLAIDDDPADLHLYERHFEKMHDLNVDLHCANSIQSGLNILKETEIDIILLDYHLGKDDGLSFLSGLKKNATSYPQSVIMITGQGDERIATRAFKSGAADYLQKGQLDQDVLARTIRAAHNEALMRARIESQQKELERMATHDELTGLLNRRALMDNLLQEMIRVGRYKSQLSLMMLDLDYFKKINDTHGHIFGDHVLSETGRTIKKLERATDISGRYGGEEFCVILPGTHLKGAHVFANRLREAIGSVPFFGVDSEPFYVTVSIGVAEWRHDDGMGMNSLLTRADDALYKAKEAGRNCVHLDEAA